MTRFLCKLIPLIWNLAGPLAACLTVSASLPRFRLQHGAAVRVFLEQMLKMTPDGLLVTRVFGLAFFITANRRTVLASVLSLPAQQNILRVLRCH